MCQEVPKTICMITDSLGGLLTMIFYSESLQSKIGKGKRPWDEVWGRAGTSFQSPLSSGAIQSTFPQQWVVTCMKCYLPRKLIRDSVPRVFIGGWSHRYPLPDTYPNSRLSETKQVLSINHVVYTNSLGTVSHSYRLMVGALPENKFPDARANLVSWPFQGQQSQTCCINASHPGLHFGL